MINTEVKTEKPKRYTYQEDFEMLILRHEYFSKVKDPDPRWVKEFEPIVKQTARIMYDKLKHNFDKVGYSLEDVIAVTNIYMISYMSIYSLRNNPEAKERALENHKMRLNEDPDEAEMYRKERNNMISFLRQRLQHASVICARKARNITVGKDIQVAYAFTERSLPSSHECILEDAAKMGYRKVTKPELKAAKIASRMAGQKELFDINGFKIIEIVIMNKGIDEGDYKCLFSERNDDIYHQNPESSLENVENNVDLMEYKEEFKGMDSDGRKSCLDHFVNTYKKNPKYKEEIATARQMLKAMKAVVL